MLGAMVASNWTLPAMAETEDETVFIDEGIVDTENHFTGNPVIMPVTAYVEKGKPTVTGCKKSRGILAFKREWLGCTAILYKVAEDGGLGDFIGIYPIEDIGYGKSIGWGESEFWGRDFTGDIESGACIDMRCASYSECVDFLKETYIGAEYSRTGSAVYFQLIKSEG